jgi:hypothetical protein
MTVRERQNNQDTTAEKETKKSMKKNTPQFLSFAPCPAVSPLALAASSSSVTCVWASTCLLSHGDQERLLSIKYHAAQTKRKAAETKAQAALDEL